MYFVVYPTQSDVVNDQPNLDVQNCHIPNSDIQMQNSDMVTESDNKQNSIDNVLLLQEWYSDAANYQISENIGNHDQQINFQDDSGLNVMLSGNDIPKLENEEPIAVLSNLIKVEINDNDDHEEKLSEISNKNGNYIDLTTKNNDNDDDEGYETDTSDIVERNVSKIVAKYGIRALEKYAFFFV